MSTKLNINAIENGTIPYEKLNNDIIEKINSKSDKTHTHDYLPLSGGTMSGNVDMGGNEIKNTNFELVESLPTENLYEGRQVTYEGKIYTYHNEKWLNVADDLGDLKETLSSEFVFRPTADTHSVKDEFASVKSIKGNTVIWNQMFDYSNIINDNKATYDNLTGIFTCTSTSQGFILRTKNLAKINHYHLISCEIKSDNNAKIHVWNGTLIPVDVSATSNWQKVTSILKCTDGTRYLGVASKDSVNPFEVKNIKAFDLTLMFGEGNEPTSVEEFEKLYSHLPADYNEGSLLNLNADSVKSIGFNQWDEEWENGEFTREGNIASNPNRIVSSFIKVIPSKEYFYRINQPTSIASDAAFYDENKNCVHYTTRFYINSEFTIPNNVHYIRICPSSTYGNTYNNDICINLSHNGERDGEYQSYEEHIVNLPIKKYFPDGLKSAGTAYDEIVFDKNIGKYKAIQRIGSVDMGTLDWIANGMGLSNNVFIINSEQVDNINMARNKNTTSLSNILSVDYCPSPTYSFSGLNKAIAGPFSQDIFNGALMVINTSFTDATSFKSSLSGQVLYYELAEPIETIIEDCDLIAYKANDWGTEEVLSEEPTTPIKADIEYNFDAVEMVRDNYFDVQTLKKKAVTTDGGTIEGDLNVENLTAKTINASESITSPTFIGDLEGKAKNADLADDLGGKPETHEENFVYQPTAADLSIKDGFADIKKLKGNTVVWNQLIQNRNYEYSTNGLSFKYHNLSVSIKGTLTSTFNLTLPIVYDTFNIIKSHKYLLKVSKEMPDSFYIAFNDSSEGSIHKNFTKSKKIFQALYDNSNNTIYIVGQATEQVANTIYDYEGYLNIIDLTQMFGGGNEPATVEEFEAMFPNDYYEYNEGELLSFDGKGLKSVGFNQFDKSKVKKNISLLDQSGLEISTNNGWCSDFIRILPNTNYHISHVISNYAGYALHYYDSNFNYIKGAPVTNLTQDNGNDDVSGTFTTPANAVYIRFRGANTTGYDNVCLSLSHTGYRNGEYEPYEDYTLQFQDGKTISQLIGKLNGEGESVTIFPDGLRSAGTVYDEIIYDKTTGKYKAVKRIGSVDMGIATSVQMHSSSESYPYGFFNVNLPTGIVKHKENSKQSVSTKYIRGYFDIDKTHVLGGQLHNVYIIDSSYTDVDSFTSSLQGQILYYELAEPEVYELDFPINTSYEAYDFGTEEALYNDGNEVNIPMKASIEYGFNAVDMIRGNYFEVDKIKKGLNEINFLITDLDVRTNDIKSNIESNELVIASAITNLEERIKELEKKINQLLTNN